MSSSGAFQYWQRTMIHSGPGTVIRLLSLFSALKAKRVALISDQGLKTAGLVEKIETLFQENSFPGAPRLVATITDVAPDAESTCIDSVLQQVRAAGADSILALGGGSVLDSAKMVKLALHRKVDSVEALLKSPVVMENWPEQEAMGIPHIAVPTTAGTGAEVTNGAIVYNKSLGIKHLIVTPFLDADIAVLDAHMTTGLPPMLSAATGLDALTHALEIVSHPNVNDFSLAHAVTSAKIILENLPKVIADGSDIMARQHMLNASAMACNALVADFGAAPVHNFAHAFGALFHIHHGEANGVFLPVVMNAMPEFYEPVAHRLADVFAIELTDTRSTVLLVAEKISNLLKELGHPQDFSRHQINKSTLPQIIQAVNQDPLTVFYRVPPQMIEEISCRVCGWD